MYAGYPPSAPKPAASHAKTGAAPRSGFVICQIPEESAAAQGCLANGSLQSPGLSSQKDGNPAELSALLTAEERASLSQKYDPSHMTQQEYHALLTELHGAGSLSEEEMGMLSVCEDGHSSCIQVGGIHLSPVSPELLKGYFVTSLTNAGDFPAGQPTDFSSGRVYSDIFAMSAWERTFQYYDPDRGEWLPTRKAQAFQRLDAILRQLR